MFRFWVCCLISFCFLLASICLASPSSQKLKSLIEQKNYSETLVEIQRLRQKPRYARSPELLYNLGLSEWLLAQYGPALAHLRQSLYLKPYSLKTQQTLNWSLKKLEDIQNKQVRRDSWQHRFARFLPPSFFFILSFVGLAIGGFFALRKNLTFSTKLQVCSLCFGLSLAIFFLSIWVHTINNKPLATQISNESVSAFSAPSSKAANIGLIFPGDAVEILRHKNSWIQIQTLGIPSGWVKETSFKIHNRLD